MNLYFRKYLKYKIKYLKLKFSHQIGGDKPVIMLNKQINRFSDPNMEKYLNPIYGLYMCESGFITNTFFLHKYKIDTCDQSIIITKLFRKIPGSIPNLLQLINNLLPGITKWEDIENINPDINVIDNTKYGFGDIIFIHDIFGKFIVKCEDGHFYIEQDRTQLSNSSLVSSFDIEQQDIVNILLKKRLYY